MEASKLTVVEHLSELRKRIIICFLSILTFSTLAYSFIDVITDYILQPAKNVRFIYVSPTELFTEYIKISLICGIFISLPIILYHIWMFLKTGLEKRERKIVAIIIFIGSILFFIGVAFSYILVIPITIEFLVRLSLGVEEVQALFSFSSYIDFISNLFLIFGIVFEMPLIVMILAYMNLITTELLKEYRKMSILIIFIIAAIVTPPDVISQLLMSIPMVILYEISIIFSLIVSRKKRKDMQK